MNSSTKIFSIKNPLITVCLPYVVYSILNSAWYGWSMISFIIIYSGSGDDIITDSLMQLANQQQWIVLLLLLVHLYIYIKRKRLLAEFQFEIKRFHLHWLLHLSLILLFVLKTLALHLGLHIHFLELLFFTCVVWALFVYGFKFYYSQQPAWNHPTTVGNMIISSCLLGIALQTINEPLNSGFVISVYWIVILLIIDALIFFSRFRYLSTHSKQTHAVARKLMTSSLLLTGIRIILGIFMPLVYAVFMLMSDQNYSQGIGLMIGLGLLFDRYLFICATIQNKAR